MVLRTLPKTRVILSLLARGFFNKITRLGNDPGKDHSAEKEHDLAQRRILIVDDDADVRAIFKLALEMEGYVASTAENGKSALESLRAPGNELPFLILCDLMMPVMNGWEFMEAIQEDPALRHIPVAAITAFSDKPKPPQARELLLKPVEVETLYKLVRQYCAS